jgi:hypothetical protein
MSQMLKLYFAPVLSRCGDWFTVTLKRAPLPELPRADCTVNCFHSALSGPPLRQIDHFVWSQIFYSALFDLPAESAK